MVRLLALFLLAACSPALASNWFKVGTNDDGDVTLLDLVSIRAQGPYLKAWSMWSLKTADFVEGASPAQMYLSGKSLYLYDCKTARSTLLQQALYDEPLGNGKLLSTKAWKESHAIEEFKDPLPGSIGDAMLKRVCRSR